MFFVYFTLGDDFTRSYDDRISHGFVDAEELVRDFSCYQVRALGKIFNLLIQCILEMLTEFVICWDFGVTHYMYYVDLGDKS